MNRYLFPKSMITSFAILFVLTSCVINSKSLLIQSLPSKIVTLQTNITENTATETNCTTRTLNPSVTTSPTIPSLLPVCDNVSIPQGKLLLTELFSGIYSISIGCQTGNSNCPHEINKIISYDGFISEATWSPVGNSIIFAANIGSPSLIPNTGGLVSEERLFTIPSSGGIPMAISSPGGFVSNINSCKGVNRLFYERNFEDITKIYIVDSSGNGSSFTQNGQSVFNPSCSSSGNDVAFLTIDNQLYIKHIGNSNHIFISQSVVSQGIWSPDDMILGFDYEESSDNIGICFAKTNLGSEISPVVLSPCPIHEIGLNASWSPDNKFILTYNYNMENSSLELFLLKAPTIIGNNVSLEIVNQYYFNLDKGYFSVIWIGPHDILISEDTKAIIIDIQNKCIAQSIDLPQGGNHMDWLPIQ